MKILFAEDEAVARRFVEHRLVAWGHDVCVVPDGREAQAALSGTSFDLVISDWEMPHVNGLELVRGIRGQTGAPFVYIIMLTGRDTTADVVAGLDAGADDYLAKPFKSEELRARISVGERIIRLERSLEALNHDLELKVAHRSAELLQSRDAVIFGLAKLAESRDSDTGQHLERICAYAECLGRELMRHDRSLDESWVRTLATTAALHDVGKVGVPDSALKKAGPLTDEERQTMQRHPCIGGDALLAIKQRWGDTPFLTTAAEIALCHHECWDGSGYPYGLAGEQIPLSARVVAVADVYDALTSKRVYKPPMDHDKAVRIIDEARGTQFDPTLVDSFLAVQSEFAAIAKKLA